MLKFENSFWDNPGPGHQPRYERGPQRLYDKLEQGSVETEEFLSFFRERAALEQTYADGLRKLSERTLNPQGFGNDDGATLRMAYQGLLSECLSLASAHSDMAMELQSDVIVPLRGFHSEHKARVRSSWKLIDDKVRRASGEISQVDRNYRVYRQKASVAEGLRLEEDATQPEEKSEFEVKPRPALDEEATTSDMQVGGGGGGRAALDVASIVLGNVALTRHEFHVMLQRMQTEVQQHDVKFGILGTFKGLISGESLAGWWCTNYPTIVRDETDALSVGQSMLGQGYLRFMGRGSQFQSRANAYYQWKKPALEFDSDEEDEDAKDTGDDQQAGRAISYERAQRDADETSQVYRDSVARAELVRNDLEEHLTNYLDTMEVWELNRLINLKSTLETYARISKSPVESQLSTSERLEVYEESVKPQQDIQWTIERYGTGRFAPRPVVFRPYALSPAEYQVFGVPLDEQLLVSHKDIPLFPHKVLSLIRKSTGEMELKERYEVWTTRALLHNIHELRNSVNGGPRVTLKQLREYGLPVVVNLLVLYLLELPHALCPEDLNDPLRTLYMSANKSEDYLKSIRNLLEGVSYAHLATMQGLFGSLHRLIQEDEDGERKSEFVKAIGQRLGPVVVRGKESTQRMAESLVVDLILHYDQVLDGIKVQRVSKPCAKPSKQPETEKEEQKQEKQLPAVSSEQLASGAVVAEAIMSAKPKEEEEDIQKLTADTQKSTLDDDEQLVDDILGGSGSKEGGGEGEDMDYFLKDEDSDDSD